MTCQKAELLVLFEYIIEECNKTKTKDECMKILEELRGKIKRNAKLDFLNELM